MKEQEFQELFHNLRITQGLNDNKARLAATWVLAARGFVADAFGCLPHLVFVGSTKTTGRDRAVRLVAASVEDFLVEVTRVSERRGIILIEDYDELLKTDAERAGFVVRVLLPGTPMRRPVLMGCGWPPFFPDSTPALVVSLDVRP